MGGFFRSKKFRIILCVIALLIGMMGRSDWGAILSRILFVEYL